METKNIQGHMEKKKIKSLPAPKETLLVGCVKLYRSMLRGKTDSKTCYYKNWFLMM